ncbi:nucleotidyl transferase AbiEii/AbiGii toxin family protein [Thermodesulfovibrio hydrogeniphilus]
MEVIDQLSDKLNDFYLAGGTALALQLGHRKSLDLDFYSQRIFNADVILEKIKSDKTFLAQKGQCTVN